MMEKIKIFAFAGSLRKGSYNKAILRAAAKLLPENAEMEIFDLEGIPLFNQDLEMEAVAKVKELKAKGVKFKGEIEERGYGLATFFQLPGNFYVQLYQPKYKK